MTALTADIVRRQRGTAQRIQYLVAASTTLFKGAMIQVNGAGFAVAATDSVGVLPVIGVAESGKDNSSGLDGAEDIIILSGAQFLMAGLGLGQAQVGRTTFVADDNTVDPTTTNSRPAGKLTEFVSSTSGWVYIPVGGIAADLS